MVEECPLRKWCRLCDTNLCDDVVSTFEKCFIYKELKDRVK